MNWKNSLKLTWDKIIILPILVALFAIVVWSIFGTTSFHSVIVGEGMSPAYNPYDMIFVKKVDFNNLKKDDAILFSTNEKKTIIIGRIKSIDYSNKVFTSKQDNVETPLSYEIDLPDTFIHGKIIEKIPSLGYIEMYGIGLLLRLIVLYLLACLISFGIRKIRKK